MEDISRELEREIERFKPKPFRKNRKFKILMVDDFGKIISGNHLMPVLRVLTIFSAVSFFVMIWLFFNHAGSSKRMDSLRQANLAAEKKINELTEEKEVLMARLVILGKDPTVKKGLEKGSSGNEVEERKSDSGKSADTKLAPPDTPDSPLDEKLSLSQSLDKEKTTGNLTTEPPNGSESKSVKKTIAIDKFSVIRDKDGKDFLVRFDIKNISRDQKEVSGRVFIVLKPDNDTVHQWHIVPTTELKNGIPSESSKGQYFSISNLKHVKFNIKSDLNPAYYKKASIFIFNNEGELVFEKLIEITDAE